MKTPLRPSAALLLGYLAALSSQATPLYWDTNGATAGAGATADGNWNTTAGNNVWSASSAGDVATQIYVANSDVVFSAGSDMSSATVTLTGAATANSLSVEEGSLSTAGTATLTVGNGGITLNSGVGTVNLPRLTLGTSATPATVAVTLNTAANVAGSSLNLGATSLTRNGLTLFRGNNLGVNAAGSLNSSNVLFGTAPTLTGAGSAGTTSVGIITQAFGDASVSGTGSDFVTYDPTNGVRLLTSSEYSSTVVTGTNVKVTSSVTNTGAVTVNSLIIGAGGSISGGTSIAVSSGEILIAGGANNGITTALSTSAATLKINAVNNLVAGNIAGGGVVNKYGAGTASFNTVDASVTVNEGVLVANGGNKTKGVTINGGTFRIAGNDTILNSSGVTVNSAGTFELAANVSDVINSLSGSGAVTGGSSAVLGVGGNNGTFTFSGTIGGQLAISKSGTGTFTFSGAGAHSGNTTVSAGALNLASTGSLTFFIGANGVSNKVTGAGAATFDGTFVFDLSGATLADGNTWTIADVATQSFSATFAVSGFTQSNDVWTNGAGLTFTEATGILSYSAIPEPSTFAFLGGLASLAVVGALRRRS